MKADLHPVYKNLTITCACGAAYDTRSTRTDNYAVDVCSACHPFFTGKARVLDKEGRVEKFTARYKKAAKAAPKA
jgi:large subunit ribosomal protein L31